VESAGLKVLNGVAKTGLVLALRMGDAIDGNFRDRTKIDQ
jgi:hypothetical protein